MECGAATLDKEMKPCTEEGKVKNKNSLGVQYHKTTRQSLLLIFRLLHMGKG